jgi:diguanylate cyclase (GGDEF)-like protein/PAS domain S-box-containing protein
MVSHQEQSTPAPSERLAQFDTLTAHMSDGVFIFDNEGRLTFANPAALRLYGMPPDDETLPLNVIVGRMKPRYLDGTPIPYEELPVVRALQGEVVRNFEHVRYNPGAGEDYFAQANVAPILGDEGQILGAVLLLSDITERKRVSQQIEQMAMTDALTGLANRYHLSKALQKELDRALRYSQILSVVMIDIDRFKKINDRFGRAVGDQALCHLSRILCAYLRSFDLAARYGGEEFVLVLPSTGSAGAQLAADRVREGLRQQPLFVPGHGPLFFTVSAGIAMFPDNADTAEALLNRADDALYHAKRQGRDRTVYYAGR